MTAFKIGSAFKSPITGSTPKVQVQSAGAFFGLVLLDLSHTKVIGEKNIGGERERESFNVDVRGFFKKKTELIITIKT